MTKHRSFKRLDTAPLATSDMAIRERTGRGWEAWFNCATTERR